ncbi:hypothetical protein GCM10023235_59260 [Kitasatospora terrestris]|uniref:Uncharacterized protein n=1 Tax=Kitasatospora terrestris TaxID=258051 RepID=A0ABP9EH57_9ACTN
MLAGALEGRVEAVYGLRNLAVADRRGLLSQTIWEQLLDISPQGNGERLLLPGLTDPAQAPGLAYTWEPLVEALHALEPLGYDVILDLGRNGAAGPGAVLARRADAVAVVVRSTLRGLSSARPRIAALRDDLETNGTGADALGLLVIGEGPYPVGDVAREFAVPALGVLPHAPRTARLLSDGGDTGDRRFIRSELMRTARTAADRMQELVAIRRRRLAPAQVTQAAPPQYDAAPAGGPAGGPVAGWAGATGPVVAAPGSGYERPAPGPVGGRGPVPGSGYERPAGGGVPQGGYATQAAQVTQVAPPPYDAAPAGGPVGGLGPVAGWTGAAASAGGYERPVASGPTGAGTPVGGLGPVAGSGYEQPVGGGAVQGGYSGGGYVQAGYGPAPQAVLPQPPGGDGQPLSYAPHIAPPAVPQPPAPAPFPVPQADRPSQALVPSSQESQEPQDGWGEVLRAR